MKKLFLPIVAAMLLLPLVAWGAAQLSNVVIESGTTTAGVVGESGASTYVIDLTKYRDYRGDVLIQMTGVSTDGTATPTTGVTIWYANGGMSTDATHWSWVRADWTAITTANVGILANSGGTVYAIDVPVNPAAPYLGLKFTGGPTGGTSPFWFSFNAGIH